MHCRQIRLTFTNPLSLRTFAQTFHMILYNVTVNIDDSVHDEWLQWMKETHISDVLKTGMFLEGKICKIDGFSEGGLSYAIQYLAPDQASYDRYTEEFAPALQAEHSKKYAGKFGAFRTVLEVIHHEKK